MRSICIFSAALLVSGCGSESTNSPTSTPTPEAGTIQPTEQEPPVAEQKPPVAEQNPIADAEQNPKADAELILGSWTSVRFEKDGLVDPDGSGGKAVFETEDAFINGLPFFSYRIDPQQTPKHFSAGVTKAIYRLEGDALTICLAASSNAPRPTEFTTKTNDGRQLIVFKRAFPLSADAPDAEYDRELSEKIKQGIELLENGKMREFGEWMGQPFPDEVLAKGLDPVFKKRMGQLLATLKVLLKANPKLNSAQDKATFDLSAVHVEGGIGHAWWFNFVKRDGKWYLVEDRLPLVK